MLKVERAGKTASVSITGEINEELVIDLVDAVRGLCEEHFYRAVEIRIASPGGRVHALEYYMEAAAEFRRRGWTIVTRALLSAESAAAVMVSMGDRRIASPSSLLRYHAGRIHLDNAAVTASVAAGMRAALDDTDVWMISALAERARRAGDAGGPAAAPDQFRESDWPLVARLTNAPGSGRAGGSPGELLGRLRRRVAKGLAKRTPKALARLYGELISADQPISAALALELRLIDELAPGGAAAPGAEPPSGPLFRVPEWRALFPAGGVETEALCRHALILGDSGSGKTVSGVLPVVRALLREDNDVGCALVVDPKRDIEPALRGLSGAPVREIALSGGGAPWVLNLMAGSRSVEDDLEHDRVLGAATKILVRAGSLVPDHPARTLAGGALRSSEPYWEKSGARMARDALALALLVLRHRRDLFGERQAVRLGRDDGAARRALRAFARGAGLVAPSPEVERLAARARERLATPGETPAEVLRTNFAREVRDGYLYLDPGFKTDFEALKAACPEPVDPDAFNDATRELLDGVVSASCRPDGDGEHVPAGRPAPVNAIGLAATALELLFEWPAGGSADQRLPATPVAELLAGLFDGEEVAELRRNVRFWQGIATGEYRSHYNGVLGHAAPCLSDFAEGLPRERLFFGCEPFYRDVAGHRSWAADVVDFDAAVGDEDGRHAYVLHPDLGDTPDALLVRALKACFFEAVLDCAGRREPGHAMPLVAYVCDEFHRFVTSDRAHGEQSYLDTARSFRAPCVLASQSMASIRHALGGTGVGAHAAQPAVDMLVTNTATKLVFRSTDPEVRGYLDQLCPLDAAGRRVTEARPPSTLEVGECYAVTADGRFERRQLEPFSPPAGPGADGSPRAPDPSADRSGGA